MEAGEKLPDRMTKVKELLERRAEGWESDEEEAGEGLYYTEKQTRVFKAIVENRDANIKEVSDKAGVHPSYVRYIVNRLPADKATDEEWLAQKAGLSPEELEEDGDSRGEEGAKTEEEDPPQNGGGGLMESFGITTGEGEEMEVEELNGEGVNVSMVRYLPVTITVTIPQDLLMEEEGGDEKLLMTPEQVEELQG